MGIFTNFIKNRSSIANVLEALDNFKMDQPSFDLVKKHSVAFFGDNWKFNLEMYIASLPQNDRAKYYAILKTAMEYEKALDYWNRALKITNYTLGVSRDDLIEAGMYKKYLSKFGVEGTRLYQKLEKFLSVDKVPESNVDDIKKTDVSVPSDYSEKLKEIIKKQVEKVSDSVEIIKEKSSKIQPGKDAVKNGGFVATLNEVIEEPKVVKQKEIKTEKNEIIKTPADKNKSVSKKSDNWGIENFYQVHEFMPMLRSVMAAVSIYKKSPSIEEYKGYVFLNDAIDYLIDVGTNIMEKTTDENMKKKLSAIVNQYSQEKLNEVEYVPKINVSVEDKPYKNPYESL